MKRSVPRILVPALLALLLLPAAAFAADAADGTVSGLGSSAINKPADALRMQLLVSVEGATVKDAIDKLKARRDEVKAGVMKLGALEASFDGGEIAVDDGSGPVDRRAAMERAMQERAPGGAGAAGAAGAKKITVSCAVKVDWPLKGDSSEGVIIQANDIRQKIKAAKLSDAPKSPAAAELAEEAPPTESGRPAGDPQFYYIAHINDAEYAKAMAEAFSRARDSAAKLAKAAGSDLGGLRTLQGQANAITEEAMTQDNSESYYDRQVALERFGGGSNSKEAFSADPGKITMQVVVQAVFTLKPGG